MVSKTDNINELNLGALKSSIKESIKPDNPAKSNPQVKATGSPRRKFTNAYRLKILTAYDACSNALERGALLRREGLYRAHISTWRSLLGMNDGGKKSTTKTQRTDHIVRENEQLKKKLAQAQAIIELQKKVSELLGTHILSHDSSEEK